MESLAWEHHLLMGWLSIAMFDYQGYICIICNRRDDIGTSFSRFIRVYEVHIAMTLPRIKMCTVYIYIYTKRLERALSLWLSALVSDLLLVYCISPSRIVVSTINIRNHQHCQAVVQPVWLLHPQFGPVQTSHLCTSSIAPSLRFFQV